MTNILGTITDSTDQPLDGTLKVVLSKVVVDDSTSPDTIRSPVKRDFAITAGVVDIDIPESETYQTTYRFTFTQAGDDLPLWDVYKIVPNVGTIQLGSFFPTGISDRSLDTSAYRMAKLIAKDPDLSQLVKQPAVFSQAIEGETQEVKFYLAKPFAGPISIKSLSVLGISGYELWAFKLSVLNSSGNEDVLSAATTTTQTESGRRRIHYTFNISRAASVMGLVMTATPQSGAESLTATLSASYTEI